MKKSIIALVASFAIASIAHAGNQQQQKQQQKQQQEAISVSDAVSINEDLINYTDNSALDLSDHSSNYVKSQAAANTAVAGPLVTSNNTCMGSTAAAGQGMSFGVSIGTTWQDKDCVRRLDAAFLAKMGDVDPARALMCQKSEVRAAYEASGIPCFGSADAVEEVPVVEEAVLGSTRTETQEAYNVPQADAGEYDFHERFYDYD